MSIIVHTHILACTGRRGLKTTIGADSLVISRAGYNLIYAIITACYPSITRACVIHALRLA